ncbi:hypothetical protein [Rudanella lutea]|nr:hypothetical protein [Rudanella lutea]
MLDVVRADAFLTQLLLKAEVETPQHWIDEQTDLPCKAHLDIRLPGEG